MDKHDGQAANSPQEQSSEPCPSGQPVGSKRKLGKRAKATCGVVVAIAVLAFLFGTHIICFHEWSAANCSNPKTCCKCGKTEGDIAPDAHGWNEANCVKPKTCGYCGLTEGEPNYENHWWEEATCLAPMTCNRCGKQKGDKTGHKYEDGICETCGISKDEAPNEQPKSTTTATTEESSGSKTKQSTISNSGVKLTPAEFSKEMDAAFSVINSELGTSFEAKYGDVDGVSACVVLENGKATYVFAFLENGDTPIYDKNSTSVTHLMGTDRDEATEDTVACSIIALVMTLHSGLSIEDAIDVGEAMVESSQNDDIYEYNGVKYGLDVSDGDATILVALG